MKLLLVTTDYPPRQGGVARYYSSLVRHLPSGTVDVLVPEPGRLWPRWLPWLAQVRRSAAKADLVWVGQVLPVGTAVWILRTLGGRPYVVSTHGMDVLLPLRSAWKRWLAARIIKSAAGITANSNFTAEKISESYGIARANIAVVYPAPGELPVVARTEAPEPTILAVGRLVRRKGFDLLIRAMEGVWQLVPDARLQIIGGGPERTSLQDLAASSSRPSQIQLLGDVGDGELSAAYSHAWVFALPARAEGADVEGFGIVCVEAAARGVPVVATRAGGIPEAVSDGQTGLLVVPGNAEPLSRALVTILTDAQLRGEMAEASPEWASRFTWDESARALRGLLERAV